MTSVLTAGELFNTPRLVEHFPFGLALADSGGRLLYLNEKARQLLLPPDAEGTGRWSCCDLICGRLSPLLEHECLSERALFCKEQVPEVRVDIERERLTTAAWVSVWTLGDENSRVLFHLRPGRTGDRRRRTLVDWRGRSNSRPGQELRISTLGKLEVEGRRGPIGGQWLDQRPGQLLKYLLCNRRRVVPSDQVVEALWPQAGLDEGRSRTRYNVHALRERIEPERDRRSPARYVVSRPGGYELDTDEVWVDADEFEREARAGLAAFQRTRHELAGEHLATALRLYKGDFLAEDPYAEWVLAEQERLRELAAQALRSLARINIDLGQLDPAAEVTRRLADLEPYDTDAQQLLIEICLRRGRRSEAYRRYERFRHSMITVFQTEPEFTLADIERRLA
ncbi:MAG TPA: BTAD domain-containing putative transcriptional regulator [Solirubrobacterales bacterium]|nr:BTAD domain-containing putative transcriptional regulator [Solirubrobacterales bacterium]